MVACDGSGNMCWFTKMRNPPWHNAVLMYKMSTEIRAGSGDTCCATRRSVSKMTSGDTYMVG